MDAGSNKTSETTISADALFNTLQDMRSDFGQQRASLEQKIAHLESELNTIRRQGPVSSTGSTPAQENQVEAARNKTSRRNLLKHLAAGAAGVAALSMLNLPNAEAAAFTPENMQINGYGAFPNPGENAAVATTIIKPNINATGGKATYDPNSPVPLLTIDNNVNAVATGSTPETLPLALYAKSNSSFAIYGYSANNAAGVIGVSKSASVPAGTFYNNPVAGVVGVSNQDQGVVGMSPNGLGLVGLSTASSGVMGVSENGIGGAFGTTTTNVDQGAAIKLGLRNTKLAPTATANFTHGAGEVALDKFSRIYVCIAGRTVVGGTPQLNAANPFAVAGPVSPTTATWRTVPQLTIRSAGPVLNDNGEITDTNEKELHTVGGFWLDRATGRLYACVQNGSVDGGAVMGSVGEGNTLPVYKAVASGVEFLPQSDRWVDTRTPRPSNAGFGTDPNTSAVVEKTLYTIKVTGVAGRDGQTIPTGAKGIIGTVSLSVGKVIAPNTAGIIKVGPTSLGSQLQTKGTSTIFYKDGADGFAPLAVKLDAQGQFNVMFINGNLAGSAANGALLIDIVAYIL